jgi:hypothetical protein
MLQISSIDEVTAGGFSIYFCGHGVDVRHVRHGYYHQWGASVDEGCVLYLTTKRWMLSVG